LSGRAPRDQDLLDEVDALARVEFTGSVWRVVRSGRDPLQPSNVSGRWDMAAGNALYTSLEPDGAIAEMHFRLQQEPVFPSRYEAVLYKLHVSTSDLVRFDDFVALQPLGVDVAEYDGLLYERTQIIGDAAQFLGFSGLIAPNARWRCLNLVLYEIDPRKIGILDQEPVDWPIWRAKTAPIRRAAISRG
jgi:hypothetical protein